MIIASFNSFTTLVFGLGNGMGERERERGEV